MSKNRKRTKDEINSDKILALYGMENVVSIPMFLKNFIGIFDPEIMHATLEHKDLEKMIPRLKRQHANEDIQPGVNIMNDPSLVYSGEYVLVMDSYGVVAPYPSMKSEKLNEVSKIDNGELEFVMVPEEWNEEPATWHEKKVAVQSYELKSMSTNELALLLKLYSKTKQFENYEVVRKELLKRDDSMRANKVSKHNAMQKSLKRIRREEQIEGDEYGKYKK